MEDDELLNRGMLSVVGDSLENQLVHMALSMQLSIFQALQQYFFAIGCWVEYLHQGLQPI